MPTKLFYFILINDARRSCDDFRFRINIKNGRKINWNILRLWEIGINNKQLSVWKVKRDGGICRHAWCVKGTGRVVRGEFVETTWGCYCYGTLPCSQRRRFGVRLDHWIFRWWRLSSAGRKFGDFDDGGRRSTGLKFRKILKRNDNEKIDFVGTTIGRVQNKKKTRVKKNESSTTRLAGRRVRVSDTSVVSGDRQQ